MSWSSPLSQCKSARQTLLSEGGASGSPHSFAGVWLQVEEGEAEAAGVGGALPTGWVTQLRGEDCASPAQLSPGAPSALCAPEPRATPNSSLLSAFKRPWQPRSAHPGPRLVTEDTEEGRFGGSHLPAGIIQGEDQGRTQNCSVSKKSICNKLHLLFAFRVCVTVKNDTTMCWQLLRVCFPQRLRCSENISSYLTACPSQFMGSSPDLRCAPFGHVDEEGPHTKPDKIGGPCVAALHTRRPKVTA